MTNANQTNRRVLLRARPVGQPDPDLFEVDTVDATPPADGDVALETLYVSVDPAMRVWISDEPSYVVPVGIGEVMRAGGVGRVLESRHPKFREGDLVQGRLGWQSHPTVAGDELTKLDASLGSALDWMGPLGGTALTAYFGLHRIGQITSNDTVLVSAAAGGVGQIAVQIAKLEGCRVVGIAGGSEKCAYLTDELGLDAAIDYRSERDLGAAMSRALPDGIDVYFDNVGGEMLNAALARLRPKGRVALCGRISQTAAESLYGITNLGELIGKRARIEGFIVTDFASEFSNARAWLSGEVKAGRLKQRIHVLDGLGDAPRGLAMLFRSENTGKLVVKVAD